MSQSTPTIVTVAQQFSGEHRAIPASGGYVTQSELQSLGNRLRDIIKSAAVLADTVEQVRKRALATPQRESPVGASSVDVEKPI